MADILTVDLAALRELGRKQRRSAAALRSIEIRAALRLPQWALAGTDIAAQCARAGTAAQSAIDEVADRVDTLADTNLRAADTLDMADDEYASRIHDTLRGR